MHPNTLVATDDVVDFDQLFGRLDGISWKKE